MPPTASSHYESRMSLFQFCESLILGSPLVRMVVMTRRLDWICAHRCHVSPWVDLITDAANFWHAGRRLLQLQRSSSLIETYWRLRRACEKITGSLSHRIVLRILVAWLAIAIHPIQIFGAVNRSSMSLSGISVRNISFSSFYLTSQNPH